jgi:anti-sigma regulatory factor (Ser/Thr protein kinase)
VAGHPHHDAVANKLVRTYDLKDTVGRAQTLHWRWPWRRCGSPNEVVAIPTRWMHQVELPGEARSVGLARSFVKDLLLAHGLAALVPDVRLVASELATNAIVHAATVFTVTVSGVGAVLLLEVRDGSRAGPVLAATIDGLATNGRGIAIVRELSRAWGVDRNTSGGKTVWAEFDT